jgi:Asp/Glu/hydantoin racemase
VHLKPDWLTQELGVPVVEGIGAPIRMAALLAGLGLKHSRKRWPKSNARPNV